MCDLYEEESPFKPCPICGARAFDNHGKGEYLECGGEKRSCPLAGYTVPVELWEALPRRLGTRYEEHGNLPYPRGVFKVAHRTEPRSAIRHVCPVCGEKYKDVIAHMRHHESKKEVEVFKMPFADYESYYLHNGVLYRR